MRTYLVAFVVSLLTGLVLTRLLRDLANRYGLYDSGGGRKIHKQPIPRLGGVAVVLSMCLPLVGLAFWRNDISRELWMDQPLLISLLGGGGLLFVVGLLDDLRDMRAMVKPGRPGLRGGHRLCRRHPDRGHLGALLQSPRAGLAVPAGHRLLGGPGHQLGEPHRWDGRAGGRSGGACRGHALHHVRDRRQCAGGRVVGVRRGRDHGLFGLQRQPPPPSSSGMPAASPSASCWPSPPSTAPRSPTPSSALLRR